MVSFEKRRSFTKRWMISTTTFNWFAYSIRGFAVLLTLRWWIFATHQMNFCDWNSSGLDNVFLKESTLKQTEESVASTLIHFRVMPFTFWGFLSLRGIFHLSPIFNVSICSLVNAEVDCGVSIRVEEWMQSGISGNSSRVWALARRAQRWSVSIGH